MSLATTTATDRDVRSPVLVCAGALHRELAEATGAALGVPLAAVRVIDFSDGERGIALDEPVAGKLIFIVQPMPTPDALMTGLLLADTLNRAGAVVILVCTYYPLARQDRRTDLDSLGVAFVSQQMEAAGVAGLITLDLHNPASEGCFRGRTLHLLPVRPFVAAWQADGLDPATLSIVAPDAGALKRALSYSKAAGAATPVVVHKQRLPNGECISCELSGVVRGRPAMLVDDLVASGSTLVEAADLLVERGAVAVYASVTHLVSPGAIERLAASPISRLFITNSLPITRLGQPVLRVVDIAPLLAGGISRLAPLARAPQPF